MALSVLARLARRNAFAEFETGESGPRKSTKNPALRGWARGSLGASGSRTFRPRNPDAGEQRDRQMYNDPITKAMFGQWQF